MKNFATFLIQGMKTLTSLNYNLLNPYLVWKYLEIINLFCVYNQFFRVVFPERRKNTVIRVNEYQVIINILVDVSLKISVMRYYEIN